MLLWNYGNLFPPNEYFLEKFQENIKVRIFFENISQYFQKTFVLNIHSNIVAKRMLISI